MSADFAAELARHRAHFRGAHLDMVIDSMLAGNTAGELWTVGEGAPAQILWDRGNEVIYLAGESDAGGAIDALASLLREELLPAAREAGVERFKVRPLSPSLHVDLSRLFPDIALQPTVTRFAVHPAARSLDDLPLVDPGVTFPSITPALLERDDLVGMQYVREEIRGMWPSEERFHSRGFGLLALAGNEVVCVCTAEYVGPTHCGIGIATASEWRRRGLATVAATEFVREARRRGLLACWECDAANAPSARVAEKVGFAWQSEETYWIGFLPEGGQ